MMDENLAKRAIKILTGGITIQNLSSSKNVEGVDILHLTKEKGDNTLERIIMRVKDNARASATGGEFIWNVTTPRLKS